MPPAPFSDLNKACGNAMDAHEAAQMHQNFSQQLLQDHIEACSLPEHNIIPVYRVGSRHADEGLQLLRCEGLCCPFFLEGPPGSPMCVLPDSGQMAHHLCSSKLRMDLTPAWPVFCEALLACVPNLDPTLELSGNKTTRVSTSPSSLSRAE